MGFWRRLFAPQLFDLMQDFEITISDAEGENFHHFFAPAHSIQSDFASIPKFLKPFFPDALIFSRGAFLHDVLYKNGLVGKVVVDALLKGVLLDLGDANEFQAEIVFLGVHLCGFVAWNRHRKQETARLKMAGLGES